MHRELAKEQQKCWGLEEREMCLAELSSGEDGVGCVVKAV